MTANSRIIVSNDRNVDIDIVTICLLLYYVLWKTVVSTFPYVYFITNKGDHHIVTSVYWPFIDSFVKYLICFLCLKFIEI